MASATVGESSLVGNPHEGASQQSKCALIELISTASIFQLKKLDHWELDGPASAINLHVWDDGEITSHFSFSEVQIFKVR